MITALLLLTAAACSAQPEETATPAPAATEPAAETVPPAAELTESPVAETEPPAEPEATPEPTQAPVDWESMYLAFLETNFDRLNESFLGGVAGVGFIDLDLDGTPELLLFDVGASASMGVQFFDIIGGTVECVSANIQGVGAAFGGANYSTVYVNCNYYDDFRLMQAGDGSRFFCVESGNGAIDFSYKELITFGSSSEVLSLSNEMYKRTEYDEEGNELSSRCEIAGQDCTPEEYQAAYDGFFATNTDTGYEEAGVFIWEDSSYDQNYEGVLAMMKAAITAYVPIQ